MQGRLSPITNGKIQEFPWKNWRQEFQVANKLGFGIMEWTLDQERLYENPLMIETGRSEIKKLCLENDIRILSLTGDCFMQAPFWKTNGSEKNTLQDDFMNILDACANLGISKIVLPLVDNGRIENTSQSDELINFLQQKEDSIKSRGLQVIFESDFSPTKLKFFINQLSKKTFGINYDIGNSASLGFDVNNEFNEYGDRILNVHIKDRVLNGSTVPLGEGDAKFDQVFKNLSKFKYAGNLILQTARATNEEHSKVLGYYKKMTENWIKVYGL